MAEIRQEIQSCINNVFQSSINESVSSPPPPVDLSGYCWVQNPARNGQYCFSGDQWNAMQDDMYTHIHAKLLTSFNVTHEVTQKVEQLKDRLYQQIYLQVMRELNATQEELHQTLDTTREELIRKINTTQDKLQQEYLQLKEQVLATSSSCKEITENDPKSSSGYYWIRIANGSAVQVYCDMDRVCGCNGTGGWARVAYLNMTDPNQQCPQAWREVSSPKRACRRTSARCESQYFNTYGINYTSVCGRVIAYQHGSTDAFGPYIHRQAPPNTIDAAYIDGVSITRGQSPRHHIWTFASALIKVFSSEIADYDICACTDTRHNWPYTTPSWVGNDYFCDSGNPGPGFNRGTDYIGDPLWDGEGCPSTSTCCQFNNPPWFCKQMPQAMNDSIEVRICGSEGGYIGISDEDLLVELIELYIQ